MFFTKKLKNKMNEFKEFVNKIIVFTDREMKLFVSLFSTRHLKKDDDFVIEGEYYSKFVF